MRERYLVSCGAVFDHELPPYCWDTRRVERFYPNLTGASQGSVHIEYPHGSRTRLSSWFIPGQSRGDRRATTSRYGHELHRVNGLPPDPGDKRFPRCEGKVSSRFQLKKPSLTCSD